MGQHLSQREATGQVQRLLQVKLPEPFALPAHLGLLAVHDLEELVHEDMSVLAHHLRAQAWPGLIAPARVADLRCPVANDQHHLMPQLLELPQLAKADCVANMHLRLGRVEALLESKRAPALELCAQIGLDQYFGYTARE